MAILFKFSDAVAIGLHAAMYLARNEGQSATARHIANTFDISETHLVKVLQAMNRAGLIRGTRGPGGGYRLAQPAEAIRLLDVVQALEGRLEVSGCLLRHPLCKNRNCLLAPLERKVNAETIDYLQNHSVRDMAQTLAEAVPDVAQTEEPDREQSMQPVAAGATGTNGDGHEA